MYFDPNNPFFSEPQSLNNQETIQNVRKINKNNNDGTNFKQNVVYVDNSQVVYYPDVNSNNSSKQKHYPENSQQNLEYETQSQEQIFILPDNDEKYPKIFLKKITPKN